MSSSGVVNYYPRLLDFYYRVVNSLKGKRDPDYRMVDCERLAAKIFLHAATINHLRLGTSITLDSYPADARVVDFPSVLVIARAVLDTYLNLFEVFFEPTSEDEFEYRHAVYQLKGFKIRELYIPEYPDAFLIRRVGQSIKEIEQMKARIKNTGLYKTLSPKQQKDILKRGEIYPARQRDAKAKAAGFGGGKIIEQIFDYFSGYVHGDALSVAQIIEANTNEKKDDYIQQSMILIMMILALVIINYAKRFPEAQLVCDAYPDNFRLVQDLVKQANSLK